MHYYSLSDDWSSVNGGTLFWSSGYTTCCFSAGKNLASDTSERVASVISHHAGTSSDDICGFLDMHAIH